MEQDATNTGHFSPSSTETTQRLSPNGSGSGTVYKSEFAREGTSPLLNEHPYNGADAYLNGGHDAYIN